VADNKVIIEVSVEGDAEVRFKKLTDAVDDFGERGKGALEKFNGAFEVFKGNIAAEAVIAGFEKLVEVGKEFFNILIVEGVAAAQKQEDALNKLNLALAASGQFSKATSKDLEEFAQGLQRTTKFSDDAVLEASALIESLGHLDKDALKGATKSALDLSTSLGVDLHTAALLVGKAAAGETATFGRYGLAIEQGATKAETFANALAAINARFGGSAQGSINTFSGSITLLKNTFEDFQKEIGNVIIKNQSLINVFREAGNIIDEFKDALSENKGAAQDFVSNGVVAIIEGLSLLVTVVQASEVAFLKLEKSAVSAEGVLSVATDKLTLGFTSAGANAQKSADDVAKLEQEIIKLQSGGTVLDKLQEALQRLRDAAASGVGKVADVGERVKNSLNGAADAARELTDAEKKLIEEGIKLADQAERKDPSKEFELRRQALEAALEDEKITTQQKDNAIVQFAKERDEKLEAQRAVYIDNIIAENQYLSGQDLAGNQERILRNQQTLQSVLLSEQLSTKERIKIQKAYSEQSKVIEKERTQAVSDSLNALATLQTAKTKELAFIGKSAAIAQTTIDTYRGAQAAAASLAGIPFVGPALAAAAAAAFITAGIARIATIEGVPLATGITEVPSGFNNDSFPARLSSGERVVDSDTNKDLKLFLSGAGGMTAILAAMLNRLNALEMRTTVNIGNRTIVDEVRRGIESGRSIEA
jgi:hypothetical protein